VSTAPIFEWLSDANRYRMVGLEEDIWPPLVQRLDGRRLAHLWTPMRARIVNPDTRLPESDLVVWESTSPPVLTPRAWSVLQDLLDPFAEPLLLVGDAGNVYVVNVTRLVPALIEPESEVFRMPSGVLADISRYALDPAQLTSLVFKLEEWPTGNVLVGEPFVRRVEEHGLTGGRFRQVWPPGQ
jgi:hypothetical protein